MLHWYSECWVTGGDEQNCEWELQDAIFAGFSLDGFGFDAIYDETAAPYQASWAELPVQTGDPAFPLGGLPASPQATTPELILAPAPLALMALGGLGLLGWRCARSPAS